MSILEELYYGNLHPVDKEIQYGSKYERFLKIITENQEKLETFLRNQPDAEEERHLFSQMINAQQEVMSFSERERFLEGFRMGARFMADTFLPGQDGATKDIN